MINALPEYNNIIKYTRKAIHDWDSLPEPIKEMPAAQEKLASIADALENGLLSKENPPIVVTAIADYR
jgi:hypothetical protein